MLLGKEYLRTVYSVPPNGQNGNVIVGLCDTKKASVQLLS